MAVGRQGEIKAMFRHYKWLTRGEMDDIIRRVNCGEPTYKIALYYDVGDATICRIYRRITGKHMPGFYRRRKYNDEEWLGTPAELVNYLKVLDGEAGL